MTHYVQVKERGKRDQEELADWLNCSEQGATETGQCAAAED